MKTALLACTVAPGQFPNEFAVTGQQSNGREFSLFVSKKAVQSKSPPTADQSVSGWIKVQLLKEDKKVSVVKLPAEAIESGYFVTVNKSNLK